MEERIQLVLRTLPAAGKIYLQYADSKSDLLIQEKKSNDFVTQADKEIETLFSDAILTVFPQDSIIQEEHEDITGNSEYTWVIDPIDGTNNYTRRILDARIQIALVHENKIKFGVIYNPVLNEIYTATIGQGAKKVKLATGEDETLHVSDSELSKSLIILTVALATGEPRVNKLLQNLQGNIGTIRIYGCAAVAFELIAAGKADGFVTNIAKPMDMAPGAIIIKEAGGFASDFNGSDWSLESSDIVVANSKNKEEFIQNIQK